MKNIKLKLFTSPSLWVIVLIVLFFVGFFYVSNSWEKEIENYKSYVGEYVCVRNDTLQIIDANYLLETYTLDDGRKISSDFAITTVINHQK